MSDPNDASGYSRTDIVSQGFIHTPALRALVEGQLDSVNVSVSAAIILFEAVRQRMLAKK